MARKGWSNLSESYRTRLGKAGISQRDYEQGRSIRAARGHAKTPERPRDALKRPYEYPEYIQRKGLKTEASPVDRVSLQRLLRRINSASAQEASYGKLREDIEALTGPMKVELARRLGIVISIPDYERFSFKHKLQIAEIWVTSFMTHARASLEPELAYNRHLLMNVVLPEARHEAGSGIDRDDASVYKEYKGRYANFFGTSQLSGVRRSG